VTEAAVRAAEAEMGLELPPDVRSSYLLHDGSGHPGARVYLCEMSYVLPLSRAHHSVVARRARLLELAAHMGDFGGWPNGPIQADWWNPRWVPLADDEQGTFIGVDLDPPPGGRVGQVIEHQKTAATRVLAESWGAWLGACADALEAGAYRLRSQEHAAWLEDASEPLNSA
jgi:cell wall assembly regulator SMI1